MCDLSDNFLMLGGRTAWFAREHGEAPQRFRIRRENWRGPTRAQSMRQGQFAILISQRIGGYIANDDRFFEVNIPSSRPCFRADDAATKSIYLAGLKAGR